MPKDPVQNLYELCSKRKKEKEEKAEVMETDDSATETKPEPSATADTPVEKKDDAPTEAPAETPDEASAKVPSVDAPAEAPTPAEPAAAATFTAFLQMLRTPAVEISVEDQDLVDQVMFNPVILETLFSHLSPHDIKAVALVSSAWREVVDQPRFWTWAGMRITGDNAREKMESRRFTMMRSLKSSSLPGEELTCFFSGLTLATKLTKLDLGRTDLSSLPPPLLSDTVVAVAEVDLTSASLSATQLESLLARIVERKDSRLRKLVLAKMSLSNVSATRLGQLVLSLEELSLLFTHLTTEHLTAILTALDTVGMKLRTLNLTRNDLSSVPSLLLSRAVLRLEEVTLFQTKLSGDQVNSISRGVIFGQRVSLKKLGLSYNRLSFVLAGVLSQAVIKLEEVDLRNTELNYFQILSVCKAIEECPSPELRLRRLNIRHSEVRDKEQLIKAEEKLMNNTNLLHGKL